MKSGTTSLYHYLRHHPQIFMPDTKEVNFFNPLRHWDRGVDWYTQQFAEAPDDTLVIGEASTSYTKFPWIRDVPARMLVLRTGRPQRNDEMQDPQEACPYRS
jgi:hypothetical protein